MKTNYGERPGLTVADYEREIAGLAVERDAARAEAARLRAALTDLYGVEAAFDVYREAWDALDALKSPGAPVKVRQERVTRAQAAVRALRATEAGKDGAK